MVKTETEEIPVPHARKYQKITRKTSLKKMTASSDGDGTIKVATALGEEEGKEEQGRLAEGSNEAVTSITDKTTTTTTTSSIDEITLPSGIKIPKGKWTPLTDRIIQDAMTSKPSSDEETKANITSITDEEVKKLEQISRSAGHDISPPILEFLAKDVPQAIMGSVSRKKIQQVTIEDLSVPKEQMMENYEVLPAARYPSADELQKMSAVEIFRLLNELQERYPAMMRERVRAEEKLEEVEAKAKRDRANLEKMKRELEEKKVARRKKLGGGGGDGDVVMGGMEGVEVVKKSEVGVGEMEGGLGGDQKDAVEKMDLS